MVYTDRLPAKFVRGAHPENEKALTDAFLSHREFVETNGTSFEGVNNRRFREDECHNSRPLKSFTELAPQRESGRDFEHARGVSAIQRVSLLADQYMVGLLERFGM